MSEMPTNNSYYLPDSFYETIKPYVDGKQDERQVADTPSKLLSIWQSAIVARKQHPEKQELIAEWAMSAGATSPLVNDSDKFENIHTQFGSLEVPSADNKQDWERLAIDVQNLVEIDKNV